MKGTDFFKSITETLGVQLPEETLTKLNEIELPDELQTKHRDVFISKERAKSDPEIIEQIVKADRKNHFRILDEKVKTFLPFISQEQANVINNTFESYAKMDMLSTAVSDAIKGSKGKVNEDVQKVENEWAEKFKREKDSYQKQLAEQEARNKEIQMQFAIESKLLGYNLAEPFQPLKKHLTEMAIIDLKKQPYIYELENGEVVVRYKDKDGVLRDKYEDGTESKLKLDKMLDTFMDKFVAKSNGAKKDDPETESGKKQQFTPQNPQGLTHRERMQQAAQA